MENQRRPFKYSYFQLTFGQEEAYLRPMTASSSSSSRSASPSTS